MSKQHEELQSIKLSGLVGKALGYLTCARIDFEFLPTDHKLLSEKYKRAYDEITEEFKTIIKNPHKKNETTN